MKYERYTGRMEDPRKVRRKIDELNRNSLPAAWDEVIGFLMLPNIELNSDAKNYGVNLSSGVSVKLFINTETGETRMFWADKFMAGD